MATALVTGCAGQPASIEFPPAEPDVPAQKVEMLSVPSKKAMRQLLAEGRYAELERALEQFRAAFLWDIEHGERPLIEAYKSFQIADGEVREQVQAWSEAHPKSYQAHTALAYCAYAQGSDARGGSWARKTKPEQFALMERFFATAEKEARTALKLQPRSVAPHRVLVSMSKHGGGGFPDAVTAALTAFPASYNVRVHVLVGLQPRWLGAHGDYTLMERFSAASQQFVSQNPRLRQLLGYPYWGRGNDFWSDERYGEAIEMYSKALEYGEETDFLGGRSDAARRSGDFELAFRDARRLEELEPWRREESDAPVKETVRTAQRRAAQRLEEGRSRESIAILTAAIKAVPDDKELRFQRADALCREGSKSVDAAIADLDEALRIDPDYEPAHLQSMRCLSAPGRITEAIRRQEAYVLHAPGNGKARFLLGRLYGAVNDVPSALLAFEMACKLDYGDSCTTHKELLEKLDEIPSPPPLPPILTTGLTLHPQEMADSTKAHAEFIQRLTESPDYSGRGTGKLAERLPAAYPLWAKDVGHGTVDLLLYFNPDGTVAGVEVKDTQPAGYFELAAVTAALRWRAFPQARGWKARQRFDFKMAVATKAKRKP